MPYFAGLQLRSNWGLSSEVEVASPLMVQQAIAKGAAVVFTPTVSVKDPLYDPLTAYTRFKLLSCGQEGCLALTRPLSSSVEDVKHLLQVANQGAKKVLSIAAGSLRDALTLIESVDVSIDAVEFDVNLSGLLASKDLPYVAELAKELSSTLNIPLMLKVSAASASLVSMAKIVTDAGSSALILTPNIVYKVGKHFFRLHSPHISSTLLLGVAEDLMAVDISLACVTRIDHDVLSTLVPLRLFDVTYMLHWMEYSKPVSQVSPPLAWKSINRKLKIYAYPGARYCPYGLIRGEGFVDGCNYCGVCLELNEPSLVELATIVAP